MLGVALALLSVVITPVNLLAAATVPVNLKCAAIAPDNLLVAKSEPVKDNGLFDTIGCWIAPVILNPPVAVIAIMPPLLPD